MHKQTKSSHRFQDTPRDKQQGDRAEHANLERPGARAHRRAGCGWLRPDAAAAWRLR
jgi:hypothetical protein